MKTINLYNRDGADLKLVSENEKIWQFQVDDNHTYILKYMRIGYKEDNTSIEFVDPSGGPYIECGEILNHKYIVDSIVLNNKLEIYLSKL